ncbi:MAG: recombinase family protein [Planctomycetes bacterium]|nr:recombinase family protein [Planctomycetota bacterium]
MPIRRRMALGYVREARDAPPPDEQEAALAAYAGFKGLVLVDTFVDEDVPGGVPLAARPAGGRLVERLERPEGLGAAVLCVRLEHLFSSATECVAYTAAWHQGGGELHILDLDGNPVCTSTHEGQFMVAVLQAVHAMEAEPGRPRHAHHDRPLLGERVLRGHLVPDPDEMLAVRRIQELSSQGKSLRLIAQALDEEGVPTKRRAKAWSKEAIRLIMRRIEKGEVKSLLRPDGAQPDGTPV